MPGSLKDELSRPYGFLFTNNNSLIEFLHKKKNNRVITIGDVVTSTLESINIIPFLSIIDGKTKRYIQMKIIKENSIHVKNEKSLIRLSVMNLIQKILNDEIKMDKNVILVDGEEDLLVIPVILFGKNNDIIIYGQPNAGAVLIINNLFVKLRVKQILEKFIVKKC